MVEEKLKQRLVGAMVLIALAVILLPSLFHQDERVQVDTTTLIPPRPTVEPIVITRPIQSHDVPPAPAPEVAFQPPVNLDDLPHSSDGADAKAQAQLKPKPTETVVAAKPVEPKVVPKPSIKPQKKPLPAPKPSLNKQGLPQSWVIQVASFQSKERAQTLTKKLLAKNLKAYQRSIDTEKGTFYRVFVGPYIDKARAESSQRTIDKAYKVSSRILAFAAE